MSHDEHGAATELDALVVYTRRSCRVNRRGLWPILVLSGLP